MTLLNDDDILSEDQRAICAGVRAVVSRFGGGYWPGHGASGDFPEEFQGIQHPLAERWMALAAANLMALQAAKLHDSGKPCGPEANAAKFPGGRASYDSALRAGLTHGGFGCAREHHVERLPREATLTRIAPVTEQLIMSFIAEKVLGQPKSY